MATLSQSFIIPIATVSEANSRECWQAKYARAKKQKKEVFYSLAQAKVTRHNKKEFSGMTVILERLSPKQLDSDNLVSSFKAIRDSVAEYLGVNDGDPNITWLYRQSKEPKKGIVITFNYHEIE